MRGLPVRIGKISRWCAFAVGCVAIVSCSAGGSNGHSGAGASSATGGSGASADGGSGDSSAGGGFTLGNMSGAGGAAASCMGMAAPGCGDGTLQASLGEQCDDGNSVSGDGCSG